MEVGARRKLDRAGLGSLLDALRGKGFEIHGPRIRDGAIVYDEVSGIEDLPAGWTDEQAPGRYRLHRRDDEALFGYAVGPHSWKRYLHSPELTLWTAEKVDDGFEIRTPEPDGARRALLGVRGCELAAIRIQDKVLRSGDHPDHHYRDRRQNTFLVAVECGVPAATCFCSSMETGPGVSKGADLTLTEYPSGDGFAYLVRVGSPAGAEVLSEVEAAEPDESDEAAATEVVAAAEKAIQRRMDTEGLAAALQDNAEHPRWDDVAGRCLACTNCTMVCPTCFCTDVEDHLSLDGGSSERVRRWDSCFTGSFSYIHGGKVRDSTRARYRQWLTHKLSTWHEQFGTSGCVGCGRCITWCPPGIDLTEEAAHLRTSPDGTSGKGG